VRRVTTMKVQKEVGPSSSDQEASNINQIWIHSLNSSFLMTFPAGESKDGGKKVALVAKTDTSVSSQRLELLEKELEDLKERVRATEWLIQDEKNLIASSKQETEDLTTQLKIELVELSALSRQIVSGEDKGDKAAIVEADRVRLEAIAAIDEFLQWNAL
jgi:hypothetical protein